MLCEKNGVLQTADVIEAGISKTYFMEYAKKKEKVSFAIAKKLQSQCMEFI